MGFQSLKFQDITAPQTVEILLDSDGQKLWVNVDGQCVLRICRAGQIDVNDNRPKTMDGAMKVMATTITDIVNRVEKDNGWDRNTAVEQFCEMEYKNVFVPYLQAHPKTFENGRKEQVLGYMVRCTGGFSRDILNMYWDRYAKEQKS